MFTLQLRESSLSDLHLRPIFSFLNCHQVSHHGEEEILKRNDEKRILSEECERCNTIEEGILSKEQEGCIEWKRVELSKESE